MDAVRESLAQQLTELRAENERLREALQRLDRAYTVDYDQAPNLDIRTCYETNSQAHAQARTALTSQG